MPFLRPSKMNRRPLALAILLLIAGITPATAIIGFCARMPCCGHSSPGSPAFATERADCCTTLTCYETPSAKLASATPLSFLATSSLVVNLPAIAPPDSTNTGIRIEPSPPPTMRSRLAILATLLI